MEQTAILLDEVPKRKTREERAAKKRAAIIRSAIAEFRKYGFHRASIDSIASGAGVGRQTIYAHFSSKAGLVEAIDRECVVWPDALIDFSYDPDASLRAQLETIGRAILTVYTSDAFIVVLRVRVAQWVETPDISGPTVTSQSELFSASLKQWVEAAARAGRLKVGNTALAANEFLVLLTDAFWRLVLGERPLPQHELTEILESAIRMFLKAYETPQDRSTATTG